MPRKPREDEPGAVHHVFAHAQDGELLFRDAGDRFEYLALLAKTTRTHGWRCLAYCLMDNHVHLLIETPRANLGAGMRGFHSTYAAEYNERHGRRGHLFRARYGSVRAQTTEQICTVATYIAFNPVRAGMRDQADGWAWSSHGARRAPWVDTRRLHEYFAANGGVGGERYDEAMAARADAWREETARATEARRGQTPWGVSAQVPGRQNARRGGGGPDRAPAEWRGGEDSGGRGERGRPASRVGDRAPPRRA